MTPAEKYEQALIGITGAKDGNGRAILLLRNDPTKSLLTGGMPGPADFRRAIGVLCGHLDERTVFLGGTDTAEFFARNELNFARNLELLTRGWIACLEYEVAH